MTRAFPRVLACHRDLSRKKTPLTKLPESGHSAGKFRLNSFSITWFPSIIDRDRTIREMNAWCGNNRISFRHSFRDHVRILSPSERKAVEFAVAENREIPLGNNPTTWNTTRNLTGGFAPGSRNGFIDSKYRNCSGKAAAAVWREENGEKSEGW